MPPYAQASHTPNLSIDTKTPHEHPRSPSPTEVLQNGCVNKQSHAEAHGRGAHAHVPEHAHAHGEGQHKHIHAKDSAEHSHAHGHKHEHANGGSCEHNHAHDNTHGQKHVHSTHENACDGHNHADEHQYAHQQHDHAQHLSSSCSHGQKDVHVHAEHAGGSCADNHAHEDGHGHKHANGTCAHNHAHEDWHGNKHAHGKQANGTCSHGHAHKHALSEQAKEAAGVLLRDHTHSHTELAKGTCGHDHAHEDAHANEHKHGDHGSDSCGHNHAHVHNSTCEHGGTCSHGGVWAYLPHSHGLHQRIHADRRSLRWAALILVCSLSVQLIAGLLVDSSVLQAEAVHTALDGMVIFVSLLSISVATKQPTARYTYGLGRAEVLSAMVSVMTLALMCVEIGGGALQRIVQWRGLKATVAARKGRFVFLAEAITLANNLLIYAVLARNDSLNVRALRAHVVGDSLGNVVVLSAGILMWQRPQAAILDPIMTLVVVTGIAALNWPLARETFDVLMQAAPAAVSVDALRHAVQDLPDVLSVHSLHVWTLTSGAVVGTLKLFAPQSIIDVDALQRIQNDAHRLCTQFGVSECTVQVNVARTATSSPSRSDDELDDAQGLIVDLSSRHHRIKDRERYALLGDHDYHDDSMV